MLISDPLKPKPTSDQWISSNPINGTGKFIYIYLLLTLHGTCPGHLSKTSSTDQCVNLFGLHIILPQAPRVDHRSGLGEWLHFIPSSTLSPILLNVTMIWKRWHHQKVVKHQPWRCRGSGLRVGRGRTSLQAAIVGKITLFLGVPGIPPWSIAKFHREEAVQPSVPSWRILCANPPLFGGICIENN